jgi:cell division protein FtsB
MNTNDIPTPSELLHSFLDGELDSVSEQELFATLAESGELRGEMRDLLAMKNAVESDDEAFTPPAETTKALFASLGFAAPIAISAPADVPPAEVIPMPTPGVTAGAVSAGSKVVGFIGQAWMPLVSATVAAVSAGIVIGNIYQNDITELEAKNNSAQKQIALLKEARNNSFKTENLAAATQIAPELPQAKVASTATGSFKNGGITTNTKLLKEIEYRDRQIAILTKENAALKEDNELLVFAANTLPDVTEIAADEIAQVQTPAATLSVPQIPAPQIIPMAQEVSKLIENSQLYIRGISARSFPDPADENLKTAALMNNMAIGYMAPVTENLALGVEFGQETFGQKFTGKADDGRTFQYEQSPNLIWAAFGGRYTFLKAETNVGDIALFGQGMIGGTTVGALGKAIAGVQYYPGSRMSVTLGAEATGLYYTYQSESYTTRKLGLTYGISYHF